MKTYLFYDIETSGLNPVFDQILTFASIRTDENFNEVERNSFIIKLRPDIVPSPQAFLVHRLTFDDLSAGISEYEAVKQIHTMVNQPGTVSLGYNTLKFDDEFLRFSFYRNLFDPYTHQYKNGCSRMDIFPFTILFYIFKPQVIVWPQNNEKISLKLEAISAKNSLVTSGRAHEAMADVEATLNLARIFAKEKEIFTYIIDFFNKQKDEQRINKFKKSIKIKGFSYKLGIILSHRLGFDANYMALAINIGKSIKYSNQNLWLRLDKESLLRFADKPEDLSCLIERKRFGDLPVILPAIDRFVKKLNRENLQIAENNIKEILNNTQDFFEITKFYKEFEYPYIPDLDPDAELYQTGFFSITEKQDISSFHRGDSESRIQLIDQMKTKRIKTLAQRIINRNHSLFDKESLESMKSSEFAQLLHRLRVSDSDKVVKGYKEDRKFNCADALKELCSVNELDLDSEQKKIIDWLKDYIQKY